MGKAFWTWGRLFFSQLKIESFPCGTVIQEWLGAALVPHRLQIVPEKVCVGSAPLTAVPARGLLLHEISMGCSFLQGIFTCPRRVSPLDAVWYFLQCGLSGNF